MKQADQALSQVTSATTKLLNTGRALIVDVDEGVEGVLSGGPLPEEYVLLQVRIIFIPPLHGNKRQTQISWKIDDDQTFSSTSTGAATMAQERSTLWTDIGRN